ncbi:Thioredoxin family domain protein [Mollivirus kamchatka]|nr:Thioredoxin family domain protein [Mollivirus kamchatka]
MAAYLKDEEDLYGLIKKQTKDIVVMFTASWCKPCQTMYPVFDKLAKDSGGQVQFWKIDVDKFEDLCQGYKISSMPTFVAISKRNEVGRVKGANERKLKDLVKMLKDEDNSE